jgi:hypothetical protein
LKIKLFELFFFVDIFAEIPPKKDRELFKIEENFYKKGDYFALKKMIY